KTMREGLFMLGASCGIDSPSKFSKEHIALRESNNNVTKYKEAATESGSSIAQVTRIEDVKSTKEEEIEMEMEEEKELIKSYRFPVIAKTPRPVGKIWVCIFILSMTKNMSGEISADMFFYDLISSHFIVSVHEWLQHT